MIHIEYNLANIYSLVYQESGYFVQLFNYLRRELRVKKNKQDCEFLVYYLLNPNTKQNLVSLCAKRVLYVLNLKLQFFEI